MIDARSAETSARLSSIDSMSLKEIIDLVDARLRFFFFSDPIFSMVRS